MEVVGGESGGEGGGAHGEEEVEGADGTNQEDTRNLGPFHPGEGCSFCWQVGFWCGREGEVGKRWGNKNSRIYFTCGLVTGNWLYHASLI